MPVFRDRGYPADNRAAYRRLLTRGVSRSVARLSIGAPGAPAIRAFSVPARRRRGFWNFGNHERLWGDSKTLTFLDAVEKGQVKKQERRAVEMLQSLCDPERFAIYLQYGDIPARGNMTGNMYLVRRFARVAEFKGGKQTGEWCITLADKKKFPETDNVVAMKNLIEGQESYFLETANHFTDPSWWERRVPAIPHIVDI